MDHYTTYKVLVNKVISLHNPNMYCTTNYVLGYLIVRALGAFESFLTPVFTMCIMSHHTTHHFEGDSKILYRPHSNF
jgi:hypothetical protein